jgi:hypothetical protein
MMNVTFGGISRLHLTVVHESNFIAGGICKRLEVVTQGSDEWMVTFARQFRFWFKRR